MRRFRAGRWIDENRAADIAESAFLHSWFERLDVTSNSSPDFGSELLLLQYLRIKTALYRCVVHPLGEGGLRNFLDHFLQIKVYAPDADERRPSIPVEQGLRVLATEYRTAPDAWVNVHSGREGRIEQNGQDAPNGYESAWVIHFKRRADDSSPLFRSVIAEQADDAHHVLSRLEARPTHLRYLRGIDICGVEGDQPLWASVQILRTLRGSSHRIAGRRPQRDLQPLRLTIHCGEDFEWLTSGLRAVAEPFLWELIERGDRIGHGIAITHDPIRWWARAVGSVFTVKRFDRILDLAFLAKYAEPILPHETEWLQTEILPLMHEIWLGARRDPSAAISTAMQVWQMLGERRTREMIESRLVVNDLQTVHEQLLHRYLWNDGVRARANQEVVLKVDVDGSGTGPTGSYVERDLLVRARRRLTTEVARWQMCIETNPSSNLIVGSLDTMMAQDFLHTRPTSRSNQGAETLTWSISTDDPISFATSLADEYAYAWAGMVLRKESPLDPAYARAMLDEAAATSMRMRFTLPHDERDGTRRSGPRASDRRRGAR
jgi:hypothetical protein